MANIFLVVRFPVMLRLNLHVRRAAEYSFSWITWWGVFVDAAGPRRPPLILSRRGFLFSSRVTH
jgi:hypothetical protein